MPISIVRLTLLALSLALLTACSTRQVQDSLTGATAQQLTTRSIDALAKSLPAADFEAHSGKRVFLASQFVAANGLKDYADRRLSVELERRFDMQVVSDPLLAEIRLEVFYTALGTDQSRKGFVLPIGFVPGLDQGQRIDLISLEQFHGVAEMYYFVGPTGRERRGELIQARTRSDALGLPIITIPISDIDQQAARSDD
jgi:hypothetical protein